MRRLALALTLLLPLCFPARGQQTVEVCAPGPDNGGAASCATRITSATSGSAEATHVIKSSAGVLYTAYATNLTSTGGFLVILNATSAPSDGAIVPLDCVPLPANNSAGSCGPGCTGINYRPGPGKTYSVGITAVVTSANTCFTKTTGTITAFISGDAQ